MAPTAHAARSSAIRPYPPCFVRRQSRAERSPSFAFVNTNRSDRAAATAVPRSGGNPRRSGDTVIARRRWDEAEPEAGNDGGDENTLIINPAPPSWGLLLAWKSCA
jgi:hypothetical protein